MNKYHATSLENRIRQFLATSVIAKIVVAIIILFVINHFFFKIGSSSGSSSADESLSINSERVLGGLSPLSKATDEIQALINQVC
jgi:hypothetical protein